MANCCVESTMREAFEKGYNVITLTDCVATTSAAGNKAAIEITYPFFSTPMNSASFLENIRASSRLKPTTIMTAPKKISSPPPKAKWEFRSVTKSEG